MALTVTADARDHGTPGLFLRHINGQEAPILTNVAEHAETGRKRGSALINIAVALLFVLALALYVVSIAAQWKYVQQVKHDDLVSWIEAASLDGGMAVFTLLALGLSRAGQSARIERLLIVVCAFGSAAMNYAAADTSSVRSALAYTVPPIFLAAVVDRTVSVIRRHYLGDDDASAWSNLGRVALYSLRMVAAPPSTVLGLRRALLNRTPVPESPKAVPAEVVRVIETRELPWPPNPSGPVSPVAPKPELPRPPKASTAPKTTRMQAPGGTSKTARLIALAVDQHNLAAVPMDEVSKLATRISADVDLHPATARRVLVAHARQLKENGGGK